MSKNLSQETKVGSFVSIGLIIMMIAIVFLGGSNNIFTRSNYYKVLFPNVEGLIVGAKVNLNGMNVGTIQSMDFDSDSKQILLTLQVARKYQEWIRANAEIEVLTQGMLGDKYISINGGASEQPMLESGKTLPVRGSRDLTQFISKGDQLLVTLNSIAVSTDKILKSFELNGRSGMLFENLATTAKNLSGASLKLNSEMENLKLKSAVGNLNGILEKINNGTGTLGALINDPGLYYDAKALMGGANRNRIVRNLVRKTIKDNEEKDVEESKEQK